jgi:hypothetical protein
VRLLLWFAAVIVVWTVAPVGAGQAGDALEKSLAAFWQAETPRDAEKATARVLAAKAGFDTLWTQLEQGRSYSKQPTGIQTVKYPRNGTAYDFSSVVDVPANYDPARKWPVRIQLHGGISRLAPAIDDESRMTSRIPGENEIAIHPRGWVEAMWWNANQVDNILRVLDHVKRRYNVDESLVYVTGISDGGTGVYFLAMREATPWSACLPLNGNIAVLANPEVGVEGELFLTNLVNCPFHAVNGGRDRLYPAGPLTPYMNLISRAGVSLAWQVYSEAGHDRSWWPVERPAYETFVRAHRRDAHPPTLSWEIDRPGVHNRIRWLVIDSLGPRPSDSPLAAPVIMEPQEAALRSLISSTRRSGRVDIVRSGNSFDARTRGVREFTILLSPDVTDFSAPVKVTVNGRVVFSGPVKKDENTLLKWAARDNDRTMLYGAELKVAVP